MPILLGICQTENSDRCSAAFASDVSLSGNVGASILPLHVAKGLVVTSMYRSCNSRNSCEHHQQYNFVRSIPKALQALAHPYRSQNCIAVWRLLYNGYEFDLGVGSVSETSCVQPQSNISSTIANRRSPGEEKQPTYTLISSTLYNRPRYSSRDATGVPNLRAALTVDSTGSSFALNRLTTHAKGRTSNTYAFLRSHLGLCERGSGTSDHHLPYFPETFG